MRFNWLGSTIIARRPVAFVNYMAPVVPGSVNVGMVYALIQAAMMAGDQQQSTVTTDLSARDTSSAWMCDYWDQTDDIVAGFKAIKDHGPKYLPKFREEIQQDYDGRLDLAEMTNVYKDIIETLASKPFEEPVQLVKARTDQGEEIDPPQEITDFMENVDGAKNNLTVFAANVFFNGINSAIHWIFVDFPKRDPLIVTKQQQQDAGIRPFWSHVLGRNVLEASTTIINGEETLTRMRILEPGLPNHIRVFERMPSGEVYWALFEEKLSADGRTKTFIMIDSGDVSIGVIPFVPFYVGRRDGRTYKIFPSMRDAADLQIVLYKQESGLNFAKTLTAYPMLSGNGVTAEKNADGTPKRINIGPNKVLYTPMNGEGRHGEWKYVEPSAESLKFLKDDIKETMDQLRELGKQPLTAQSGNLTVITTAVAAGKSRSAVSAWAERLSDALENAMHITAMWLDMTEDFEPEITVYDEFDDFTSDQASDLAALQAARVARDLSYKNYIRELKRRGLLRADFDADENTAQLLDETPTDINDPNAVDDTNPAKKPKPPIRAVK